MGTAFESIEKQIGICQVVNRPWNGVLRYGISSCKTAVYLTASPESRAKKSTYQEE